MRPTVFRISGTVDLETSNFAYRLIIRGTNVKKCKIRLKREGKGSRDPLRKFWVLSIYRERLDLETSNLAYGVIKRCNNERKCKIRSK